MKILFRIKFVTSIIFILLFNSVSFSQLSGTYTIGSGGDFTTINAAVSALVTIGVNAPVNFNIMNGNYNEVVTIDSVRGVSLINTVTFQSQSGNASDVNIYSNSTSSDFIIKITRADFIKFQNISFKDSLVSNQRRIIELEQYSDNISFINNILVTNGFNYFSASYIIYSANHGSYIIFRGNIFIGQGGALNGTKQGIRFEGSSTSYGVEISNNSFSGLTHTITVSHTDSLLIEKNIVNCGVGLDIENSGIFLNFCKESRILKNNVITQYDCGPTGIGLWSRSGTSLTLVHCVNSLIANNFFNFRGCGAVRFTESSHNIKFYYNTVAGGSERVPLNLGIVNSDSISLINNIHVNANQSPTYSGVIYNFGNSLVSSNYNAFRYYTENLGIYNGVNIPNLPAWRTATGDDYNSRIRGIGFVSSTDLHLNNSSLNDDSLKGIPLNEVTDDYDSNPRDPLYPTMGADEPAYGINITVDLVLLIEGFYNNPTNSQVEDTVRAYLRTVFTPYSIVDSSSVNVRSNGFGKLRFFNALAGTYYIEVNHRNSIETWSKTGGESLTPGTTSSYNFTNSISQAFGKNLILKKASIASTAAMLIRME